MIATPGRVGLADLPLHTGRAPAWLFGRMVRLAREVLAHVVAGDANKEIARRLAISPRTVEIHRGNMMTKLDAGHAADAVRLWIDAQQAEAHGAEPTDPENDELPGIAGRIGTSVAVPRRRVRRRVQRQ